MMPVGAAPVHQRRVQPRCKPWPPGARRDARVDL